MKRKTIQYSLRIPKDLMDKLGYIARRHGRTKNRELLLMIDFYVRAFERKQGVIELSEERE